MIDQGTQDIGDSDIISMSQAAERLGVTRTRVRHLLLEGKLRGGKYDDLWLVSAESVEARRKLLESQRRGQPVAAARPLPPPDSDDAKPSNPVREFASRPKEYAEFKRLYQSCKGESFRFYGQTVLKQYAMYLIQAVDMELGKR